MRSFAQTADAIRATSKKTQKLAILAEYLRELPVEEAAQAAVFFSGRPFPAHDETTLQVGGSLLWRVVAELAQVSDDELATAYRRFGDLGDATESVLAGPQSASAPGSLPLAGITEHFRELASARGPAAKSAMVLQVLKRASPGEAKYLIKIMLGDLRIGLRESLVEEAISKAFSRPPNEVQRANMLLGDIGETLRLAAADSLRRAQMRLFHPIGFMLAAPAESAAEAFCSLGEAAAQLSVEDKYDGIRGQAHVGTQNGRRTVRIFSRNLDDVTDSFPELIAPLSRLPGDAVLDGEIVAWERTASGAGRALPFSALQQRLGRKRVSAELRRSVPLVYVAFDVLYAGDELVIDRPLRDRGEILDRLLANAGDATAEAVSGPQGQLIFEPAIAGPAIASDDGMQSVAEVIRAPSATARTAEELENLFELALARGNEGLMIKDLASAYTPGRRGGAWLKLKRELATLDVVVTAAEYGHGKRAGVLSDYTFAVREDAGSGRLLNVGKAYSGLTDIEIQELTAFFLEHTMVDEGFRRQVEPLIVLEVAFNNVMISDRHSSGFALRFPRIVRIRRDKLPAEIDTLARVREIYERQHARGQPAGRSAS